MTGTTNRRPFPELDEAERTRHKGELDLPEPVVVVRGGPRRGLRLLAARHRSHPDPVRPAVRARGDRGRRLRPVRCRRAVGPGQPAGLGDLRVGATRHVVARLPAGLVRADGGPVRRHPALAAAAPRGDRHDPAAWTTLEFEYVVVGLGALGSATAYQLAKRGHRVLGLEQFELGHARGASHDTSRILRHSYHTPGLRDDDLRGVRRLGHARDRQRRTVSSRRSAGSTSSRRTPPSRSTTTRPPWPPAEWTYETLDVARGRDPLAAVRAAGRDRGALPGPRLDRAGGTWHRGDAGPGPPVRGRAARRDTGAGDRARSTTVCACGPRIRRTGRGGSSCAPTRGRTGCSRVSAWHCR